VILEAADLTALRITLELSLLTTLVLLPLATPLAWWLARTTHRARPIADAMVALPLVLPPTVLGFYVLLFLGPRGPLVALGLPSLAFSFTGLLIGSVVYSLPFAVQPLRDAFSNLGHQPLEAAATLRAGPADRFFTIVLPLARPAYLTAAVLSFAHTLGEFGVVLMVGGNIPGRTRVVSIAIYDHVESLNYGRAHALAALLLVVSSLLLVVVYAVNRRIGTWRP
jgi:molybdate transport system permease protein